MEWTDSGRRLIVWAAVAWCLAALTVVLRLISRGCILHVLGPTDAFIALPLLFSLVNTVAIGFAVDTGLGRDVSEFSPGDLQTFLKVIYGSIIVTCLSISLTKMSILLLFLDIFVVSWVRRASYVLMAILTICGLWTTISNILFCIPVSTFWESSDPDVRAGKCIDNLVKNYADAALNLALDFAMFFLPLSVIWQMTLPWRQKIWLYTVFGLGFFVCVLSVLRFYFIYLGFVTGIPEIQIVLWSMMEINVPIIIACIPMLKPLVDRFWPQLLAGPMDREMEMLDSDEALPPPTISSPPRRSWSAHVEAQRDA